MNNAVSGPKEPLSPLEHQFRLLKHLGIDTNSKIKVATGADDDSTWVDADGTNAVTPS